MYINYKNLIRFLLILTVVFTAACNDNKEKIEILKIDDIWKDSVPEDIISKFTLNCYGVHNYLLIPSSVQKDSDINIKLYGCWDTIGTIVNGARSHFFESTKKDHKIILTVFIKIPDDKDDQRDDGVDHFGLKSEYNITNDFEVGDVEFVVKNPGGEELTTSITIE